MQRRLLRNGFKLLKEEGTLVYSTCSLSRKQNEDIVQDLLLLDAAAEIVPIHPSDETPCQVSSAGTIRFNSKSETSGLFVARITKKRKAVAI